MIIVTDTHPWVWFLTANPRLSLKGKDILSDPSNLIVVPSIVMLELKYLYIRKRISLTFGEALHHLELTSNVLLHPLDLSIVAFAPDKLEIHDAIIVGTALYLSEEFKQPIPLITCDKTILDSGLVQVIW